MEDEKVRQQVKIYDLSWKEGKIFEGPWGSRRLLARMLT